MVVKSLQSYICLSIPNSIKPCPCLYPGSDLDPCSCLYQHHCKSAAVTKTPPTIMNNGEVGMTHASRSPLFFMIVNFPDEAAATICFSIESLILLDNCYHISLSSRRGDATYLLMSGLPNLLSNLGSNCDSSFSHSSRLCPSTRYLCFSFILCCSLCHLVVVGIQEDICARDRQIYYQEVAAQNSGT
jgi:hypothetical protein